VFIAFLIPFSHGHIWALWQSVNLKLPSWPTIISPLLTVCWPAIMWRVSQITKMELQYKSMICLWEAHLGQFPDMASASGALEQSVRIVGVSYSNITRSGALHLATYWHTTAMEDISVTPTSYRPTIRGTHSRGCSTVPYSENGGWNGQPLLLECPRRLHVT